MFCPNCGAEIANDAKFCTECGSPIQAAQQPQEPQQPVNEPVKEPEAPFQSPVAPVPVQTAAADDGYSPDMEEDGYRLRIKPASIIAYLFGIVGFVIAYVLGNNKNDYLRFHLNQALVFAILEIICYVISKFSSGLGGLLELVVFILWFITFIGVCKGQRKVAPIVGGIQILK